MALLYSELHDVSAKWMDFGLQLGVRMPTLKVIELQYHSRPSDCLRETLKYWLKNTSSSRTWEDVAVALESETVKEKQMAATIRSKHPVLECTDVRMKGESYLT